VEYRSGGFDPNERPFETRGSGRKTLTLGYAILQLEIVALIFPRKLTLEEYAIRMSTPNGVPRNSSFLTDTVPSASDVPSPSSTRLILPSTALTTDEDTLETYCTSDWYSQ